MAATKSVFGAYQGQSVFKVTLMNERGTSAEIITYGGSWHGFKIPDKKGMERDIIVSPKTLKGYIEQFEGIPYFFGGVVGRHAGRINRHGAISKAGRYDFEGDGRVHLHGGKFGFARKNWNIERIVASNEPSVTLSYHSEDGEEGYPGNLTVEVAYQLFKDNAIAITYSAISNKDTIVNLTNHAYFNLGGESITKHSMQIDSDSILEVEKDLIPTGKMSSIATTEYDFTQFQSLGKINEIGGLDDTYILRDKVTDQSQIRCASSVSGIEMKVNTDQPAVVVFAPKSLSFIDSPKNNELDYADFPAICFETQNPPDAIHHPHFAQSLLKKGTTYTQNTLFSFEIVL